MWAPPNVRKIWIFTFELEDIARLGGLGTAVKRHIEILERLGYELTILMPSHGRHFSREIVERYNLRFNESFRCCGSRRGVDGRDYHYCLGSYEGRIGSSKIVLFIGLDPETGYIIDKWSIYDNTPEKTSLMIRALNCWLNYTAERPDLLIGHDWHGGLIASAARIFLEREGLAVPYIYFIHLLSSAAFPYHYISADWSGVPDTRISVWRFWRHEFTNTKELWDRYKGYVDMFNIELADVVASVSYGYVDEILSKSDYRHSPKTCVVYNTTDWSISEVERYLATTYGTHSRCELRWRFYRDVISKAKPCIGHIEPGGFLVLSGGRLTWQKGFDIIIRSLEFLDERFKLLILGIGVGDVNYENHLRELASRFWGRVLVSCNSLDRGVYQAFNYLANLVVVFSRYEPFGLASIEAQAVGTPVVISRVPGLAETVRDLRLDPMGTGLVAELEDPRDLAVAIKTLALITEAGDCNNMELLREIPEANIRELVKVEPRIARDLRRNCTEHINRSFRTSRAESMFRECIEKARLYAYYRSHTR
ncbi:MAG: glycosyltransferase [Sulfolobales archaeon]